MPLLDRLRRTRQQPGQASATPPGMRLLVADGQRIDLTARDAGTRISLIRQNWQDDAWTYRDMIGELRYAQRLLSRSVAKARFYAAEIRPFPELPVELTGSDHGLDPKLAQDAVENLQRLPLDDGPDGFVALLTENILTAGEGYIHGEPDDLLGEKWSVRSISEIVGAGDQVMLSELPNQSSLGQRRIDPLKEELLRCWTRHPRWGQLADSPLRAMLDVLEEVVLTGREMRAAARSRIASNGVLLVPTSLTLLRTREDDEELQPQGVLEDDFMREFTEALTAPIRNEGSPGSVVPLILRGDAEALKEVRHLALTRDDAAKLMDRLQGAVLRMLQGLDIQPEQVQGIGANNHWGGWLVEASNVRHQVDPTCGVVGGCFTKAFLRPALVALGHDPNQVARIGVWHDLTGLVESPDRSQDARDAWDRDGIKDSSLREALGFTEDDAPDPREYLIRLLSRGRLTPQAVPLVAALSGVDLSDQKIQDALRIAVGISLNPAARATGSARVPQQALPPGDSANPAQPGQIVPDQPTPTEPTSDSPPGLTAAGAPGGWRVDTDTARALTDIDAALLERLLTAADAAVARAVERAGGRIRNAVRKDQQLAASLDGVGVYDVAKTIGRDRLTGFASIQDLLAGAYQRIGDQFQKWLTDAARAAVDAALRLMGLDPTTREGQRFRSVMQSRYDAARPQAWLAMQSALDRAAERALFRDNPLSPEPSQRGERSDTLVSPADMAGVLTIAGGGRPREGGGGFATGQVVTDAVTEAGGVLLGWEWRYRPEVARGAHFPPHVALDGTRFSTWTDPKLDNLSGDTRIGPYFHPQDHPGCRCASAPIIAFPEVGPNEDPDDIVGSRLRAVQQSERGRLAARVAAQDTAAGRIGTSLQNEVEVRDRITAGVERLRSHYIG